MKTQIISILDGVVFGKLRYKFLTTISAIVITTAIGMLSLHLGLPRKYMEILAFGLPIPIFIVVCITFENLRNKLMELQLFRMGASFEHSRNAMQSSGLQEAFPVSNWEEQMVSAKNKGKKEILLALFAGNRIV